MNERRDKQAAVRKWLGQHIHYCVSELVYALARSSEFGERALDSGILAQDDWQTPAYDAGYRVRKTPDGWVWYSPSAFEGVEDEEGLGAHDSEADAWRAACEDNDIESYQVEALEHWLVSNWLADRLAGKGEMVCKDFLGLTIWGRACTGQAIYLDSVVEEIYDSVIREIYNEVKGKCLR